MKWEIKFYKGVDKAILNEWPIGIRTKFTKITEMLIKYGPEEIGMPYVRPFGKGLFEIRAQGKEGIGRALFCLLKNKKIFILSEFIKKTQKTPKKELDLAIKRMQEVKNYG